MNSLANLKQFFLFVFLFFFSELTLAQSLKESKQSSEFTYIFKLKADDVEKLIELDEYNRKLPEDFFNNKIDSFYTDSSKYDYQKLPFGNYLEVKAVKNELVVELVNHLSFNAIVVNDNIDFNLSITNIKNGVSIPDADVSINKKKIKYDSKLSLYRLPKSNKKGVLKIEFNNQVQFFDVIRSWNNPMVWRVTQRVIFTFPLRYVTFPIYRFARRSYYVIREAIKYGFYFDDIFTRRKSYKRKTFKSAGYLALNSVKYKPNDTLKFKAYISNKKGRPRYRKFRVEIQKSYYDEEVIYSKTIKAKKGNVIGELILGDTLKIDTKYDVYVFNNRGKKYIVKNSFKLEDYQLEEGVYSVKLDKKEYSLGEDIRIDLKAENQNEQNLLNVNTSIFLLREGFKSINVPEVFIPDTIWSKKIILDPLGGTVVTIPDSIIPNARFNALLKVQFKNSNNELKNIEKQVLFTNEHKRFKYEFIDDSIHVSLFKGKEEVSDSGKIVLMSSLDTTQIIETQLPVVLSINNHVDSYQFISGDFKKVIPVKKQESLVQCISYRTEDSVYIELNNPRKLKVNYSIFKDQKQIIIDTVSTNLFKVFHDLNKKSFSISCNYVWANEGQNSKCVSWQSDKDLYIDLNQPEKIIPGSETQLEVNVTKKNGMPSKHTNLTVGGFNSKFEDAQSSIPLVPRYSKSKGMKYVNNFDVFELNSEKEVDMYENHLDFLNLRNNDYYSFRYPSLDSIVLFYDSTYSIDNAQFAPFVFDDKGEMVNICYFKVDDELIFIDNLDFNDIYSFVIEEGFHSVLIRTLNKEYKIDSLNFKNGEKLLLSFHENTSNNLIDVKPTERDYSKDEREELLSTILFFDNSQNNLPVKIHQGTREIDISRGYYNSGTRRYRYNYQIGPFNQNKIYFEIKGGYSTNIVLDTNSTYFIKNGRLEKGSNVENNFFKPNTLFSKGMLDIVKEEVKVELTEKQLKKEAESVDLNITYLKKDGEECGDLFYKYEGDSSFCLALLIRKDSSLNTYLSDESDRFIYNIKEGIYELRLVTTSNYYLFIDSLEINKNGINCFILNDDSGVYNRGMSQFISNQNHNEDLTGVIVGDLGVNYPFCKVSLYSGEKIIGYTLTDLFGKYSFYGIERNIYSLSYEKDQKDEIIVRDFDINSNSIISMNRSFNKGFITKEVLTNAIKVYEINNIKRGIIESLYYSRREDIVRMATRSANSVSYLSIRGSRSDASNYYIDGIKVRGSSNLPKSAISEISMAHSFESKINESLKGNEEENNFSSPTSNSLRSNFRDYAFWEPNIYTDKYGKATVKVKYPDNITKWKLFALAANGKYTGQTIKDVKAYKTLMAQLSTPRFMIEGDETNVIGKISNYNSDTTYLKTVFRLNGQEVKTNEDSIIHSLIETLIVESKSKDTLNLSYELQGKADYFDGEERRIPVLPKGMLETKGTFNRMDDNSIIDISFKDTVGEIKLYAQNDVLYPLLNLVQELENYPYACMEQTSSKLMGYLMKKDIYETLGERFRDDRVVEKLISKLEEGVNDEGYWGWWPKSRTNIFMTCYVLKALDLAEKKGYKVSSSKYYNINRLKWQLDLLEEEDLLEVMLTLSVLNESYSLNKYLAKMNLDKLSLKNKITYYKILQLENKVIDIKLLLAEAKETVFGNVYWEGSQRYMRSSSNQLTLGVYQILQKIDSNHTLLPKIRNFFLESNNQTSLNTIDKASIVKILAPYYTSNYTKGKETAKLSISGDQNLIISDFPYELKLNEGVKSIQIKKDGLTPVYVTTYQKNWNVKPLIKDSVYHIETHFEQNGSTVNDLVSGVNANLIVSLEVKKKSNYTMIEIPIPAGCSYGDNENNYTYSEVHREYHKEKTNIYIENLEVGSYKFVIALEPRFKGIYSVNPVKVEQMYYPVFYGNNEVKKISINN